MRTMTKTQMSSFVAGIRKDVAASFVCEYASGNRIDVTNDNDNYYAVWRLLSYNGDTVWVQTYEWNAWVDSEDDGFDPEADALIADMVCADSEDDDGQPMREKLHSAEHYYKALERKPMRPKGAARIAQFLNCDEGD